MNSQSLFLSSITWTLLALGGNTEPVVEVTIPKPRVVVGEPIVVDFEVRNEADTAIQSAYMDETRFSMVSLGLTIFCDDEPCARWLSHGRSGTDKLLTAKNPDTGQWHMRLEPDEHFRARKLVVPLLDPRGYRANDLGTANGVPLPPGKYTLIGSIPWVNGRIESPSTSFEVLAPARLQDRAAANQIDIMFVSFMGGATSTGMRFGMKGMEPTEPIRRILDDCPNSIHAEMARSRLLVLQVDEFRQQPGRAGPTQEIRAERQAQMFDMVEHIESHLKESPDDPLELELLLAKVKLLRMFEVLEPLDNALSVLIERYAESGYAKRAREMKQEIAEYRARKAAESAQDK